MSTVWDMTTHPAPVGTGTWQSSRIDGDPLHGARAEPWDRAGLPSRQPGLAMRLQYEQDLADEQCDEVRHARRVLARRRVEMSVEEAAAIVEDLDAYEQEQLIGWLSGYDPDALRRYVATYEQEQLIGWLSGYDPDALRRYVATVHRRRAGRAAR